MALNLGLAYLELLLLASLALFLHAVSRRYGLAPLLIYLSGLVVTLQSTAPTDVQLTLGTAVINTSSVILVPVILMTLLVLYEAEGTASARLAILGIIGLSVMALVVQLALMNHMHLPGGGNSLGLPPDHPVYRRSWGLIGASILALSGSLVGIVVTYQISSLKSSPIPVWLAPGVALLAALILDEAIFTTAYRGWGTLTVNPPATLGGKLLGGLLVWPLVAVYLRRVAPKLDGYMGTAHRRPFDVIFGSYKTQESALSATKEERKRAEAALQASELRFRTTVEQVGVGLVHTSPEGKIRMVNQAMCELVGYSEAEFLKLGWEDFTHPEELSDTREGAAGLLEGKTERYEADKRYIRKDGTSVWAHITVSLVRDGDGKPAYFVSAVEDLTHRMATEAHLRQAQKMEAVGQLTGGIAHDFNNLLTVIMGGVEMGMDPEAEEEEKRKVLGQALTAAIRGASLTHRLLAFSRNQPLRPVALDTREVLDEMREILTRTLGETIRIKIDAKGKVGNCLADRAQLENAVLNLALNGRDAMDGGGQLQIRSESIHISEAALPTADAQPGHYVRISVTDEGSGIPEANMAKVFDPFFTTKATGKGSGLGLSMVYGFAHQSGGFVTLESTEGKGTTIRLHLPSA